jgi:hypothetical protein
VQPYQNTSAAAKLSAYLAMAIPMIILVGSCLVHLKIPSFFTLSITLIFSRLHGVLNIGKKITNYTV